METRSKKRKRQRLISIASNVSSWPDVPASFESLNDDTLTTILKFVGNKSYRSFGGLNYHCKEIYLATEGMTKETFLYGYAPLSVIKDNIEGGRFNQTLYERVGKAVVYYNRRDVLAWILQRQDKYLLGGICNIAAEEGRIDVLEEVWNNVNEDCDKKYVFEDVDQCAASGGKINVLKWADIEEFDIDKKWCAEVAAKYGHLHVLQWLKEEKGLLLRAILYYWAIDGDQSHVMKWLREQEVDWYLWTFTKAAQKGNLDILQWLHDEGCPWPEHLSVHVSELKPEAQDWLIANGYGDKIVV